MPHEFINPNWHVIIIHYPIALLSIGLIVEILSIFKPKGGFRAAGRWIIGIGALLALPALTTGLYAMRDTVTAQPTEMESWHEVVSKSQWTSEQWDFISRHIWLNATAAVLGVILVFIWLSSADRRRRKIYWLCLLALIAVNVLVAMGAWHGGELAYRFGTGVARVNPNPESNINKGVDYWASPLQVHLFLAGLVVASCVVGISLMFRTWEKPVVEGIGDTLDAPRPRPSDPLTGDPTRDRHTTVRADLGEYGEEDLALRVPPRVYPGWFYFTGFVLAAITALFGYWETMNAGNFRETFSGEYFSQNARFLKEPDHRRLLIHVILGVTIIVLPILLGLFGRAARRARSIAVILTLLLVVALAWQMWMGILILFDGHEGSSFRFNTPAKQTHDEHQKPESADNSLPGRTTRPSTRPASTATTRAI